MGTWGYAIDEDDTALDAYDEYMDLLNVNSNIREDYDARVNFAEQN